MRYSDVEEICLRFFDSDAGEFRPHFRCDGMTADVLGALVDAGERGVVVDANDAWFTSSLSRLPGDFKIISSTETGQDGRGNLVRYVLRGTPHVMLCKRAGEFYQGRYREKPRTSYAVQSTWHPFDRYRRRN